MQLAYHTQAFSTSNWPLQTSALELLLSCYFQILLTYHSTLYLWNVNC